MECFLIVNIVVGLLFGIIVGVYEYETYGYFVYWHFAGFPLIILFGISGPFIMIYDQEFKRWLKNKMKGNNNLNG